jgi:hypothetical protein
MSAPSYDPNQTSISNALAGSEYGYTTAPLIEDPSSFAIRPTGKQANLEFLSQPYNEAWPDALKDEWEKYHMLGISTTPSAAAEDMTAALKAERDSAAQAADPMRQAEVATARAGAAQKQAEIQMPYLTELQYQDVLSRLRNPNLSFLEKQQLIAQANGYASMIAQMQPNTGKSAAALGPAATAIGKINPINDYGPQIDSLMRSSESRMSVARQALDAAGVPLPEFAGAPPPPEPNQLVVEQFGMKKEDGTPITFRGSPVIRTVNGGNEIYERLGTDGKFYTLTEKEVEELTGGR